MGGRPSRVAPRDPDAVARFVSKARAQRALTVSRSEDSRVSNIPFPPLGEIESAARFVPKPRSQRAPILSSGILSGSEDFVGSSASLPPSGEMAAKREPGPPERFRFPQRRAPI